LDMFWECPTVVPFWTFVSNVLSDILHLDIPQDPLLFLLLDDSSLQLNSQQKRTLLAARTAAKKTILKLWIEPSIPTTFISLYFHLVLETLYCWKVPLPRSTAQRTRLFRSRQKLRIIC